jgi:hypothetical protein
VDPREGGARASGGSSAHTKSKEQADAVDALEHLTETATQAVLAKVGQDVLAQKSAADIAADALAALKQSVSLDQLGALAKRVAGIGKDELAWYLTHLLTAKAAPALSAAQGKTLLVPVGSMAGLTPEQKRNQLALQGHAVPAL